MSFYYLSYSCHLTGSLLYFWWMGLKRSLPVSYSLTVSSSKGLSFLLRYQIFIPPHRLLLAYLWISRPLLSVVYFTSIRFSSKVQCECVIHRFIVVRSKEPSKEVEQKRRWKEWIINYSSEGTRRLSKVQGSAIVQVQQQLHLNIAPSLFNRW